MLEIKVQCDCGQRYKFDVEPVNGRMPFVVNCPICGLDGTPKANEILQRVLPPPAAPSTPPASKLRLSKPTEPPPAPPPPPAGEVPAPAPTPRPISGPAAAAAPPPKPAQPPSFGLGLLGALVGTLVGSTLYFLVFNYTGFRLKLLAVGVGFLAGYGAELLGRKEGSKELGMIAAALTLAGIVSAQYFVARSWWQQESGAKSTTYEARVEEAKKAIAAIPTGSDQEISLYLAKQEAEPGEKPDPQSVSAEEIKDFRETTLPQMRDLAGGKLTKEDYQKKLQADQTTSQADKDSDTDEGTFKAVFLLLLLSKINLVSLCAGAGLAFKLCSNA